LAFSGTFNVSCGPLECGGISRQQAAGSRQQAAGSRQQAATGTRQPAPGNRQPATGNHQPPTTNHQPPTTGFSHEPLFIVFVASSVSEVLGCGCRFVGGVVVESVWSEWSAASGFDWDGREGVV
jgi:hypothetical protein